MRFCLYQALTSSISFTLFSQLSYEERKSRVAEKKLAMAAAAGDADEMEEEEEEE